MGSWFYCLWFLPYPRNQNTAPRKLKLRHRIVFGFVSCSIISCQLGNPETETTTSSTMEIFDARDRTFRYHLANHLAQY